ncbi:MAG: hypothetical protein HZA67_09875 [Rhodospirillales bacterium]|nr:hypothetical protein [Rhodospirillales bacterium]
MTNALSPNRMTAAERLDEVAEILAVGVMRLVALKSRVLSEQCGESSLDFVPDQSGHANTLLKRRISHDR